MLKNILKSVFILSSISLFAQNQATISGKVTDKSNGQPLEYATIVLQDTNQPDKITGGVTNVEGKFEVEAPKGNYLLKVSFFSYKDYVQKNFLLTKNQNLGTIYLEIDVAELDAVEVVGELTTVEMHLDKKIYNVGTDMTVKGGSITDVLGNVPSITVDVEGAISLRGSENVKILINGKPSALSGMNNETLQQLPAESIEKIEVITNPSSRYDAEGTAGIINIILKKGKGLGFTGSTSLNLGYPENLGASLNLNWRKDKWTFFNNTNYRYRKSPTTFIFNQQNFNSDGSTRNYQDENRDYLRESNSLNLNFGVEYRFDDQSSITHSVVWSGRNQDKLADVYFQNYDALKNPTIQRSRITEGMEKDQKFQYALNFEKKFDEKGQKLTADYQYSTDTENSDETIREYIIRPRKDFPNEQSLSDEKVTSHLAQLDYVLPFGDTYKSQFEAGYRGNLSKTDIDFKSGEIVSNALVPDPNYSNHFIYDENIQALYSQFGTKINQFNIMAGLRMEYTKINSELVNTQQSYPKDYISWFPSLFVGYEFSEGSQLSVNYTRRLQRPRSFFINPFVRRSGKNNVFSGNPDIDPTFTNAFELGYLKRWDKITLNTSLYYNLSTQAFTFVSLETGDFVSIQDPNNPTQYIKMPLMLRTPINLSDENRVGVEFTTTYTPFRNWRLMWNVNFFKKMSEGNYTYTNYLGNTITQNFDAETTSWFSRLTAKVPLFYGIDFQTVVMYMGPKTDAQSESEDSISMDLALSKDILKGKGSLSLNVSDVFDSRWQISDIRTANVLTHSEMQRRKRQINLNFTYRFGNGKSEKTKRQKGDSMEDDDMTY